MIGHVQVGAFAPESAGLYGIKNVSLAALDNEKTYALYRLAIRNTYGAELSDMNYLGVGSVGWEHRMGIFRRWLFRASAYGDPTIAIEPTGPEQFGAFADTPEMRELRSIFRDADIAGIIVWVRFASECNLRKSVYSVYYNKLKIAQYRSKVRWFHAYMPANARLVFSPLVNTVALKQPQQLNTIRSMYEPGVYARIGGTLYATQWIDPNKAFAWYHTFMRRLDATTPFQICELGGTHSKKAQLLEFLTKLSKQTWPDVQRVNLFAGELNSRATTEQGRFGFVDEGQQTSYIMSLFSKND